MRWSKEIIMTRLQDHYNEALQHFPEDRIVGIFLQGSQNYGLATPYSDIDTKLIVLPTLDDICFNHKAVSTTHVRENDEHIDFKDIRLMFQTFRKQNLNFVEILFTEYRIINPKYVDLWDAIDKNKEEIARYNAIKCCKTMKGIAAEKYHAMEHRYPSRIEWLDKYGYDPKQLHHLLRIKEFLYRYLDGEPFEKCLKSNQATYLIRVKQGLYDLEQARFVGTEAFENIKNAVDEFAATAQEIDNPNVDMLLDQTQVAIMRRAIELELEARSND